MTRPATVFLLTAGVLLQAFALFGNRSPYPLTRDLFSPDARPTLEAYEHLERTDALVPGDPGFKAFERALASYMDRIEEAPFPPELVRESGLARVTVLPVEHDLARRENHPIRIELGNGAQMEGKLRYARLIATYARRPGTAVANVTLALGGTILVFLGIYSLTRGRPGAIEPAQTL